METPGAQTAEKRRAAELLVRRGCDSLERGIEELPPWKGKFLQKKSSVKDQTPTSSRILPYLHMKTCRLPKFLFWFGCFFFFFPSRMNKKHRNFWPSVSSKNQRITEWFGLEGTLKIVWFQIPCHGQGHFPLLLKGKGNENLLFSFHLILWVSLQNMGSLISCWFGNISTYRILFPAPHRYSILG